MNKWKDVFFIRRRDGGRFRLGQCGTGRKPSTEQSNILCLRNVNLLKNIVQRGLCGEVPEREDTERSSWQ